MNNSLDIKIDMRKLLLVFFYFCCVSFELIIFFYYRPQTLGEFQIIFYFFMFVGFFTLIINLKRKNLKILNAINFIVIIYLLCFCFRPIFLLKTHQSYLFNQLKIQISHLYIPFYMGVVLALISMTLILIGYTIFIKNCRMNLPRFLHTRFHMKFNYGFISMGVLLWLSWVLLNGGYGFLLNILKNPYAVRAGTYVSHFGFLKWGIYIGSLFVYANVILAKKIRVSDINLFLFYCFMLYTLKCSVSEPVLYLLGFVIVYDIAVKPLRPVKIFLIFLVIFSLVLFLKYRLKVSYAGEVGSETSQTSALSIFDSMEKITYDLVDGSKFAGIDVFTIIVSYFPDRWDYIYGRSFIDGIIKIIPFVDQTTTGAWLKRIILNTKIGGNNPTLPGIFYLNFGVPGIIFFSFLFGCFCAVVENYMVKRPSFINILVYTTILVFFILFISRTGAFTIAIKKSVYLLVGLFFYNLISITVIKNKLKSKNKEA